MTSTSQLFPRAVDTAGILHDGRQVSLQPMTATTATTLGSACATMDPWQRYGISAERLTATFAATSDSTVRYQILVAGNAAGAMIMTHPWLLGPYLQFIAVLPEFQRHGVGRILLSWFEHQSRAAQQRNMWLCVTGFNDRAQAVYLSDGWEQVAMIPDLVATGVDEILMRKRLF